MFILTLGSHNLALATNSDTSSTDKPVDAQQANKTILVIGDSLSAEYGIERGSGWVEVIRNKYLKPSYPDYQVVNASISGDTTSGGLSRVPALLAQQKVDIALIELGANDALRGLSLDQSRQNLEKMRDLIHAQGGTVVFIGMQIPPNFGPVYTKQFTQMFEDVSTDKDSLVPFLMEGFALDMDKFQADGIHPNESAQEQMAENVWPALEKALQRP